MSSVSVTAIAYLSNPRQEKKSKVFFFDARMFLNKVDDKPNGIGACLRYFNALDFDLPPHGLYLVHCWVGEMDDAYPLGDGADIEAYDFVGDIQMLAPLHEVEYPVPTASSEPLEEGEEGREPEPPKPIIRMPKINTEYPPYVTFSGVAINIQKAAAKFDMDVMQYLLIAGGKKVNFPVTCWIVNSYRWSTVPKPVPFNDRYVTASGHLVGIENGRYKIDVDNVTFLGSAKAAGTPSTPAPSKRSSFEAFDSTPSWVTGKRQKTSSGPSSSQS